MLGLPFKGFPVLGIAEFGNSPKRGTLRTLGHIVTRRVLRGPPFQGDGEEPDYSCSRCTKQSDEP